MHTNWTLLVTALGLAFVIEGLPYFLFAERMPRVLLTLARQPSRHLRILGLTAIILGILMISLGRSL
jgi:uncharacterized protein YjeT (DUF2065 family)